MHSKLLSYRTTKRDRQGTLKERKLLAKQSKFRASRTPCAWVSRKRTQTRSASWRHSQAIRSWERFRVDRGTSLLLPAPVRILAKTSKGGSCKRHVSVTFSLRKCISQLKTSKTRLKARVLLEKHRILTTTEYGQKCWFKNVKQPLGCATSWLMISIVRLDAQTHHHSLPVQAS